MCFTNFEPAEVFRTTRRRARKAHRCDDCHDGIQRGEMYRYSSGIFDGEPFSLKTCRRCLYDISRIYTAELAEGCPPSESTPPTGELYDALCHRGWSRTPHDLVPTTFVLDPHGYPVSEDGKNEHR